MKIPPECNVPAVFLCTIYDICKNKNNFTSPIEFFCNFGTKFSIESNTAGNHSKCSRRYFLFFRAYLRRTILANAHKLFVYRSCSYSDKRFKIAVNLL